MKPTLVLVFASLATAIPAVSKAQGKTAAADDKDLEAKASADSLIFGDSLQNFLKVRNGQDRGEFDWSSDGCTMSPDNPFGFPFLAACQRHDFGYRNYKAQGRFTDENRKKIDDNFHKDLEDQCHTTSPEKVCDALANVYYWAVRAFGGISKRGVDESAPVVDKAAKAEYDKAKAAYEKAVKAAQANGELPVVDH